MKYENDSNLRAEFVLLQTFFNPTIVMSSRNQPFLD